MRWASCSLTYCPVVFSSVAKVDVSPPVFMHEAA